MITKPGFNFSDIDKLNYSDINAVSVRLGEDSFDPKTFLGISDDISESSQENEVFKRFRKPSLQSKNLPDNSVNISDAHMVLNTPSHFPNKKFSKPSNYSYADSKNSNMVANKFYDRTLGSQELNQMNPLMNNYAQALNELPSSQIGRIPPSDGFNSPMNSPYRPLNQ